MVEPVGKEDQNAAGHHAAAPPSGADHGAWHGQLIGIGSEWSPQFPGYLAGAVDAAERGLRQIQVCRRRVVRRALLNWRSNWALNIAAGPSQLLRRP
jgi:hypothetical protein